MGSVIRFCSKEAALEEMLSRYVDGSFGECSVSSCACAVGCAWIQTVNTIAPMSNKARLKFISPGCGSLFEGGSFLFSEQYHEVVVLHPEKIIRIKFSIKAKRR